MAERTVKGFNKMVNRKPDRERGNVFPVDDDITHIYITVYRDNLPGTPDEELINVRLWTSVNNGPFQKNGGGGIGGGVYTGRLGIPWPSSQIRLRLRPGRNRRVRLEVKTAQRCRINCDIEQVTRVDARGMRARTP